MYLYLCPYIYIIHILYVFLSLYLHLRLFICIYMTSHIDPGVYTHDESNGRQAKTLRLQAMLVSGRFWRSILPSLPTLTRGVLFLRKLRVLIPKRRPHPLSLSLSLSL